LRTGLLVATGATALSFGLQAESKQARSETELRQMKRRSQPPAKRAPFPKRVSWPSPNCSTRLGSPGELPRQAISLDSPQTPEKIALGEKSFFDGWLSADGSVACSTCRSQPRFH
jgi:cytochrome c peroxidase